MKQIYINTMFGTTRIDYDETDSRDIIIVAGAGIRLEGIIREHIEFSGINPTTIETFQCGDINPSAVDQFIRDTEYVPAWQEEKRRIMFNDMTESEEYMRDLIGDDAYENFESQ